MFTIRFHGRGGQGMKTASRLLGSAFFLEGFEVQDAPRYGAERRFRRAGFAAVLLSGLFLAFLLFTMIGNGLRGFTYTSVTVPIDFAANPLTVTMPKPQPLAGAELVRFRAATAPAVAKLPIEEYEDMSFVFTAPPHPAQP